MNTVSVIFVFAVGFAAGSYVAFDSFKVREFCFSIDDVTEHCSDKNADVVTLDDGRTYEYSFFLDSSKDKVTFTYKD